MAQEAENRLFRFDIHIAALIDDYKQRIAAAVCQAEDVLLVFSVTGRPRALIDCAIMAREAGAMVISVTRPGSPLAEASGILLPLDIPDNDRRFEIPNRSRYGSFTSWTAWRRWLPHGGNISQRQNCVDCAPTSSNCTA